MTPLYLELNGVYNFSLKYLEIHDICVVLFGTRKCVFELESVLLNNLWVISSMKQWVKQFFLLILEFRKS